MASNLTNQVRSISEVTKAVALGDLSKQVNVDVQREMLDLKMTVSSMLRDSVPWRTRLRRDAGDLGWSGFRTGGHGAGHVEGLYLCFGLYLPHVGADG